MMLKNHLLIVNRIYKSLSNINKFFYRFKYFNFIKYMFYVHSAMPNKRKGANLSRQMVKSRVVRDIRARRSSEQIQENNADQRIMSQLRESQSQEKRDERNQQR